MSIAIVFPLYNEEENILPLLNATLPVITKLTKDFEIIFVDDGSKDRSPQILKQLNKEKYIKVYTLKKNMGKATKKVIVSNDCPLFFLIILPIL